MVGNPVLHKKYVLQDLKSQAAGTGVVGMVYVQASWALEYSLLEADYVANLAAYDPSLAGEDPAFGLRPDFIRGVQILPEYGLSFDLLVKGPPQTASAIAIVRQCRLMYGGDSPPVLLQTSYANWVQTAKELTSSLGAAGQRKFFADNARAFYRLTP